MSRVEFEFYSLLTWNSVLPFAAIGLIALLVVLLIIGRYYARKRRLNMARSSMDSGNQMIYQAESV